MQEDVSFAAPEELATAVDAYNRFLADMWQSRQGEIERRGRAAVEALDAEEDDVRNVGDLVIDLQAPPRLTLETTPLATGGERQTIVFAAPGEGSWNIAFRAEVQREVPLLGRWHRVKARVRDLRVELRLLVERRSPLEAELLPGSTVTSHFELDLDASNTLLDLLIGLLEDVLERQLQEKAAESLAELLPDLTKIQAIGALALAADPPPVLDQPAPPADLEQTAYEIAARIRDEHLPWDTLLSVELETPDALSPPRSFAHFEDSAIWTGHYVAGETFRYLVTRDSDALVNVERALAGLEALTELTVDPGLLSRVAVPTASPHAAVLEQDTIARGKAERLFTTARHGEEVLAVGHVTRDQYAGAFLGTGLAALLLDDEVAKAKARDIALSMASYLVSCHFCPAEARQDAGEPERTSVTYALAPTQVLAILALARRLDPARFSHAYEAFAPIAPILWLFVWLQTLDPDSSYYKFNLEHALAFLLLSATTDEAEKARLAEPLRVIRHALRHHDNAWFNLVELATLRNSPDSLARSRAETEREVRSQLSHWRERSPVMQRIDLRQDLEIDKVVYPGLSGEPREISRHAVSVGRRPSTDFLWQRSPFKLVGDLQVVDGVSIRPPGLDYHLPYWLARWLGVL